MNTPPPLCACLETGPKDPQTKFLGIDPTNGRYGEVTIQTCRQCQNDK